MSTGCSETIESIIGQLERYLEKLSSCGEDPDLDVAAITGACRSLFADLQGAMPSGLATAPAAGLATNRKEEIARIEHACKGLQAKTGRCAAMLRNALDRKEEEIGLLRGTRKAMLAYGRYKR